MVDGIAHMFLRKHAAQRPSPKQVKLSSSARILDWKTPIPSLNGTATGISILRRVAFWVPASLQLLLISLSPVKSRAAVQRTFARRDVASHWLAAILSLKRNSTRGADGAPPTPLVRVFVDRAIHRINHDQGRYLLLSPPGNRLLGKACHLP